MKPEYKAVVIGGGIVGASLLYHLTKFGWHDVALVERSELTAGSTWHAAAGFHALNGDPNVAALQDYTINLYREIEAETGLSCGLHMTGGVNIATTPSRWEQLKAGFATFQAIGIETSTLMTTQEIRAITGGLIRTDDVLGGLHDSNEGYLDPNGATHAFAAAARERGAKIILRNRVVDLVQRPDDTWDVVTLKGTIHSRHVVNAAGLWAKQVGLMAGVDLPVTPMEHHYLITDPVEGVRNLAAELPVVVDPDGLTYTRQEHDGLLLGLYESTPRHWMMDGAPWNYGMELIPPDIDRIGEELAIGFERFPGLGRVGIRKWVNGAFTFTPDGNPLIGPVGKRGYWVACGVMAGFSQGGGVGKSLAEWMIHGASDLDVFGMDVARFGPHHSNKEYIRQTTAQFYARRFAPTYPNEQRPAGRVLRTPGAYRDMTDAGAQWGNSWGLEIPLYFKPDADFSDAPTLRRSAAFPVVGGECLAVRHAAGLLDISGFARYRITGPGAHNWLDRLLACRLPGPGKVRLAPMLGQDGRLKGDLTCFNWGDGSWWLMGSYHLRAFHMRWFNLHMALDVRVQDISDTVAGFSVNGPKARDILASVSDTELGDLGMMSCRSADIGLHRVCIARLSLSGELAYEVSCAANEHAALRNLLSEAGAAYGLREIGFDAMYSMRLEKSIGIWNAEFTQACTAAMTGLDRWVALDKGDFIGRAASLKASEPTRILAMLEVEAQGADASGFEPVWQGDALVGIITSGAYGHRLGRSLAMAMMNRDATPVGTDLSVHLVGERYPARVIGMSPYDETGARMRA